MKYAQSVQQTKERYARQCAAALRKDLKLLGELLCEHCGGAENIELHHPNYDDPKRVEKLCRKCHREWHALLRQILREVRFKTYLRTGQF